MELLIIRNNLLDERNHYGNCLFGALKLALHFRTFKIRFRIINFFPHFYVLDQEGNKWHFRVVKYIFDLPFLFIGRYEKLLSIRLYEDQVAEFDEGFGVTSERKTEVEWSSAGYVSISQTKRKNSLLVSNTEFNRVELTITQLENILAALKNDLTTLET